MKWSLVISIYLEHKNEVKWKKWWMKMEFLNLRSTSTYIFVCMHGVHSCLNQKIKTFYVSSNSFKPMHI